MFRSKILIAAAAAASIMTASARAQDAAPPAPAAPPAEAAPAPLVPGVALPAAAQPEAAAPSSNSGCDFAKLANARVAQIASLNRLSKGKAGKMDPVAACSKLQGLVGIDARMVAFIEKNKDWCGIPDEAETNVKKSRQTDAAFAGKACAAAANYRKQLAQRNAAQRAAANGGAAAQGAPQVQRLPAGPL